MNASKVLVPIEVVEPIAKSVVLVTPVGVACIESVAYGDVVPIPIRLPKNAKPVWLELPFTLNVFTTLRLVIFAELEAMTLPKASVPSIELVIPVIAKLLVVALVKVRLPKVLSPVHVLESASNVDDAAVPLNAEKQVPFTAKQPEVMLKPTLDVEVAEPETVRPESVVVPKPVAETDRKLVFVDPAVLVDEAIEKSDVFESPYCLKMKTFERGVVVPMPILPDVKAIFETVDEAKNQGPVGALVRRSRRKP